MENKTRGAPTGGEPAERASGSVDRPIRPDEAQPGDRAETGAALGGPVDVAPGPPRGRVDHRTPELPTPPEDQGETEKRRG